MPPVEVSADGPDSQGSGRTEPLDGSATSGFTSPARADPLASTEPAVRGEWHRWVMFFVAFWVLASAWSLAVPRAGGPDEPAHVLRAASVVRGQIVAEAVGGDRGGYAVVQVPALIKALMLMSNAQSGTTDVPGQKPCYASKRQVSAACIPEPVTRSQELVDADSGAARYNPVYYALVGWPTLLAPNEIGIVAIRLVSAGLCSTLFASAFCSMAGVRRGRRTALVAALAAATPTTIFLAGVVNPNALEIAAALSLWAAGLRLVTDAGAEVAPLVRRFGVAASLLVLTRSLSPLWLLVALVVCLAVSRRTVVRAVIRRRQTWAWAAVVGLSGLAGVGWTLLSGTAQVAALRPRDVGYFGAIAAELKQFDNRMVQIVGFFGWNDTPAPWPALVLWAVLFATLLIGALSCADPRRRAVLAVFTVAALMGGFLIEATQYHLLGLFWQSRYSMPMIVGVPLLAGLLIADSWPTRRRVSPHLFPVAIGAVLLAQLLCFGKTLIRFEHGLGGSVNPFTGDWTPAVGAVTVIAILLVGLALLAYAVTSAAARPVQHSQTRQRISP